MIEHALKCENNAIFEYNFTPKLFIAFKMAYYYYFIFEGNLDFLDFLKKQFYNMDYRKRF